MKKDISQITDFRSALEYLKEFPGELIETNEEVDPVAELAGVYRHIGAGGTVQRPTRKGPAMIFNNVKGHPGAKIAIGVLASRQRVARILGAKPEELGFLLKDSVTNPIDPVEVSADKAKCQEVVHYATDPDFDVRKIIPASTTTEEDGGPYITMGMCYGTNPENGESDITIHRLCLHGKDEMSIFFTPGARHIEAFFYKAEALGKPLPISINIGVDPAIEIAACFEAPTTPMGFNELSIAGALRGKGIEMVKCLTINEKAIANAEYVIEAEVLPNVRVKEDAPTNSGHSMPEFPGYNGPAYPSCSLVKVKAVTHRKNPIMQTCIGPSEEHVSMAGIPTEASIINMIDKAMPGRLKNVYAHSAGGGKYMAVLQFRKIMPSDEGRQRQAAMIAFSAFPELKNVIIVDEDVDPFDSSDVLWSMNTRFQSDVDIICVPGVRCHPLDPSNTPEYNPNIKDRGIACKTIFDCTVPYALKAEFTRAKFKDVDPKRFAPELFREDN